MRLMNTALIINSILPQSKNNISNRKRRQVELS